MKIIYIIVTFLLLISTATFAATSSSYFISAEVFELGGTTSESISYKLLGKARNYQPNQVTSPGYVLQGGFMSTVYTGVATESALAITSIVPNFGYNDSSVSVEIFGSGFSSEAQAPRLKMAGETDIIAASFTIVSSTEISCIFDLTNKKAGPWSVAVINPGPIMIMLYYGFTINSPPTPKVVEYPSNEPNPFNPATGPTAITFKLSTPVMVTLYMFNQNGEIIWQKTIDGSRGDNTVLWDGLSRFKETVPTGVYVCRLVARVNGRTEELARMKIAVIRK